MQQEPGQWWVALLNLCQKKKRQCFSELTGLWAVLNLHSPPFCHGQRNQLALWHFVQHFPHCLNLALICFVFQECCLCNLRGGALKTTTDNRSVTHAWAADVCFPFNYEPHLLYVFSYECCGLEPTHPRQVPNLSYGLVWHGWQTTSHTPSHTCGTFPSVGETWRKLTQAQGEHAKLSLRCQLWHYCYFTYLDFAGLNLSNTLFLLLSVVESEWMCNLCIHKQCSDYCDQKWSALYVHQFTFFLNSLSFLPPFLCH